MTTITAPPQPSQKLRTDDPTSLLPKKLARSRPLFDPEIVEPGGPASFVKLNPVTLMKNPVMFVVEVGAALTTVFLVRDLVTGAGGIGFRLADLALALVHRAVRQLRRSDGGSARQGPGRHPAQDQDRRHGQATDRRTARSSKCPASELRAGDVVICEAGDLDPRRWRSDRGHRDGG